MSHVTDLKPTMEMKTDQGISLKLEFKNMAVLRDALESIQGTISQTQKDFYGVKHTVDIAISTKAFPAGIGFVKAGDKLVPKADAYGKITECRLLMEEIQQKYQHVSLTNAFKRQGYSVSSTRDATTSEYVLVGRKY